MLATKHIEKKLLPRKFRLKLRDRRDTQRRRQEGVDYLTNLNRLDTLYSVCSKHYINLQIPAATFSRYTPVTALVCQ